VEQPEADNERSAPGYTLAIIVSALGHAAVLFLALFVVPTLFSGKEKPPPVYTVKIMDNIPAGDLGTHLPKLAGRNRAAEHPKAEPPKTPPPERPKTDLPLYEDKNSIALNSYKTSVAESPTPTPTPTPPPPELTPSPTSAPMMTPAPATPAPPTPEALLTPKPKRERRSKKPKATPLTAIAKPEKSPSVKEQLAKLREQLLKDQLKEAADAAKHPKPSPTSLAKAETKKDEDDDDDEETTTKSSSSSATSGPIAAKTEMEGSGAGIGPGTGSAGIQNNLDFLLYYRSVQEKIKKAWSFSGGSSDLTATVTFQIGTDGNLQGVKITQSSKDSAYDDSVLRAIRRAAPFAAPPEKYRPQFSQGIEATFKLGEMSS